MRDARPPKIPAKIPAEIAGSLNLLAHPAASAAALSALSLGLASQMLGMWMGAVAGATEASRRILETLDERPGRADEPPMPAGTPQAEALPSATVTVLAEARQAAAKAARKAPAKRGTAQETAKAARQRPVAAAVAKPAAEPVAADVGVAPGRPEAMAKPARPDDLKAIGGIGPKLETVLNNLGIWTYAQIAAWKPAEVAWVDDYLSFRGRIDRDGWVAQAAALAGRRAG
ncbi:MAG: NADH-ubiquinone dehydrogenase [Rhizobiaceae bacterium]|nr:NADH-ubiquinone dehydrogenase [Rhizobiaceae bacterium]